MSFDYPDYYYLSYCMLTRNLPRLLLLAILVLFQASGRPDKRAMAAGPGAFRTEEAFPRLHFDFPVDITHSNDGTNRLFVVEQAGVIKVFENKRTTARASSFLDIRNKVSYGG
jgi:hypothetical protein